MMILTCIQILLFVVCCKDPIVIHIFKGLDWYYHLRVLSVKLILELLNVKCW